MLPRSLFTTDNDSEQDSFQAWREEISVVFDLEPSPVASEVAFHATMDTYRIGELLVGKLDSSNARYRRDSRKIASDGLDMVLAQLLIAGEIQFGTGRDVVYARAGDIIIFDIGQKFDNVNVGFRHLTVAIPRSEMEARVPGFSDWHGKILPRDEPSVKLFRSHLLSLFDLAPSILGSASLEVEESTVSLLAGAFGIDLETSLSGNAHDALGKSIVYQIKKFIRANLGSPRLSPEEIATTFGISRARLYRLMESSGGIAGAIKEQRLERCIVDLTDTSKPHATISEIAYRWGFSSPDSFSRLFRQAYGMSPRDFRKLSEEADPSRDRPAGVGADRDFQRWIKEMAPDG